MTGSELIRENKNPAQPSPKTSHPKDQSWTSQHMQRACGMLSTMKVAEKAPEARSLAHTELCLQKIPTELASWKSLGLIGSANPSLEDKQIPEACCLAHTCPHACGQPPSSHKFSKPND